MNQRGNKRSESALFSIHYRGIRNSAMEEFQAMERPGPLRQRHCCAASVFRNRRAVLSAQTQLLGRGDVPLFCEISRNPRTRDEGIHALLSGRHFGGGCCGESSARISRHPGGNTITRRSNSRSRGVTQKLKRLTARPCRKRKAWQRIIPL
jgi:hypothetical protein